MNRFVIAMLGALLLEGCGPKQMTVEDAAKEKQAVESAVISFWKSYEARDTAAVNKFLSSSSAVTFFGTDSAEVIKSLDQWKAQMSTDMKLFDKFKAGDMKNVSTEISGTGDMASMIAEIPVDMRSGRQNMHALARCAMTLRKENNEWRITQGMVAFASKGQSSAELVAKMKAPKKGGRRR